MLSAISINKMVKFHLYIIVALFIVLAGLSLKTSSTSQQNFEDTIHLHGRVELVDQAMYKLMVVRGNILLIKIAALENQPTDPELVSSINIKNKVIRETITKWVKEPKSTEQIQELSERTGAMFIKILDSYMNNLDARQQGAKPLMILMSLFRNLRY